MKKQEKIKTKSIGKKVEVPGAKTAFWERRYFFEGLVFCFCFFLYANTIPNNYNLDDELVTINHRLTSKGISAIPEIFTSPYYEDASGYSYEYRPMVLASFAIEHDIFGENPHWGHFWNVILYALSCTILYRVLLMLFRDYSYLFSLAITLLFAAHTAHTEVVCSIKNRDEILGLLFSILALGYGVRAINTRKYLLLVLVPFFFTLSLLSKLSFVSFAFIIPLAVLFFCEASFAIFLYIIVSLVIPLLCLMHFSGYFKLELLIFVVGAFSILHLFMFPAWLRLMIERLKNTYRSTGGFSLPTTQEITPNGQSFFRSILPDTNLFSWWLMLLSLAAIATFIIGTICSSKPIEIATISIVGLMLVMKNTKAKWFGSLSLYSIAAFCFVYFPMGGYIMPVVSSLSVAFFYLLLYGDRKLFIPILFITLAVVSVGEIHESETIISVLSLFLIISLPKYRWGIIVALFIALIEGMSLIRTSQVTTYILIELIPFVLTLILLLSTRIKKWGSLITQVAFFSFILFAIIHIHLNQDHISIQQAADNLNPVINIKQENRPLLYVEDVVKPTDPLTVRVGTSLEIMFHYLYKVVLPYPLSFYYGYQFITQMKMTDSMAMLSLLIHLLLLILALFYWNKNRALSFSLWLYLASIATFANFFQPIAGMLADRFLLVPSIGWSIILVLLILRLTRYSLFQKEVELTAVAKPTKYVFVAILLGYSVLTFSRNMDWHDHLRLFRHDINYVENSSQAHNLLALRLMKNSYEINDPREQLSMHQEALGHFKKAISLYPDFFNATYDLGRTYSTLNEPDSALIFYKKAALMNSAFINAHIAAGEILMQQNKFEEAKPFFEHVIRIIPTQYVGYDKLSYIYFVQKDYTKSLEINKLAVKNMPGDPTPCINLGKTYRVMGQEDSARYYLKKALDISPNNAVAKNLLGPQSSTH